MTNGLIADHNTDLFCLLMVMMVIPLVLLGQLRVQLCVTVWSQSTAFLALSDMKVFFSCLIISIQLITSFDHPNIGGQKKKSPLHVHRLSALALGLHAIFIKNWQHFTVYTVTFHKYCIPE